MRGRKSLGRRKQLGDVHFETRRIEPQRARKDAGSPNARREINGGAISGSAVGAEELILQQLQLMAHQLETLRAGASQP